MVPKCNCTKIASDLQNQIYKRHQVCFEASLGNSGFKTPKHLPLLFWNSLVCSTFLYDLHEYNPLLLWEWIAIFLISSSQFGEYECIIGKLDNTNFGQKIVKNAFLSIAKLLCRQTLDWKGTPFFPPLPFRCRRCIDFGQNLSTLYLYILVAYC